MSAYYSRAHIAFSARAAMRPALAVLALSSLLIGCSVHPLPDDVSRRSTFDIVENIRCEAKAAVEDHGRDFQHAQIAYDFSFRINETNDTNVGFSLLDQLKGGNAIRVNTGAQSKLIRDGNRSMTLLDSFEDLRKLNCTRDRETNFLYPLTGDVGMYNAVSTFIKLQRADNPGATRTFTFADTLTYTTTLTGGINATLTLTPAAVLDQFRFTAANAAATGKRMDIHRVTVTMAAGEQIHVTPSGRRVARQVVPRIDARVLGGGDGSRTARDFRTGDPGSGGGGGIAGPGALGVAGGFNNLLSTRMLQQESGAENRALYELDRQRQLELQRRATDIRVLVGP
jgi:hypothetical protein